MRKKVLLSISAVAVAAAVGWSATTAVADAVTPEQHVPAGAHADVGSVEYAKNGDGLTYGSAADSPAPGQEPDLITAFGDDGVTPGYVKKADLNRRTLPKSPAEVEERAKSGAQGTVGDIEVPLFAQDGKTVVGVFTVKGWGVTTQGGSQGDVSFQK